MLNNKYCICYGASCHVDVDDDDNDNSFLYY